MRFYGLVWVVVAALAFVSPAMAQSVLHRGNGSEPGSLDPHKAVATDEARIIADLLIGLTSDTANGDMIPAAAESWTTSQDGLVWTFTLRSDLVWSDGAPVTAEDFVFSWRRLLDPNTASQYSAILFAVKNARAINANTMKPEELGVRAVDDRTFEVTLEHLVPYLPYVTVHHATFAVPRHVVSQQSAGWAKPGKFVGNGAYLLESWQPEDRIKLIKNPRFYDAASVLIDEVYYYPFADQEAGLKRFRDGSVDMINAFPHTKYDWVKANMADSVQVFPILQTIYFAFNTTRPPFSDKRVREAFAISPDIETIGKAVNDLGEPVAYAFVPPTIANYPGTTQISFKGEPHAARVERAKALLTDAGFGPGNPVRVQFNIINTAIPKRLAVAFTQMWTQIGAQVEIVGSDANNHWTVVMRERTYDIGYDSWVADFSDPITFLSLYESTNEGFNDTGWKSPQYDELLAQAGRTADLAERGKILSAAEKVLLDDFVILPFRYAHAAYLVAPHVKGFQPHPRENLMTRWLRVER
jgi:oligopeptide transport system substrate-binding protein